MARFSLTQGPMALVAVVGGAALAAGAAFVLLPRQEEPATEVSVALDEPAEISQEASEPLAGGAPAAAREESVEEAPIPPSEPGGDETQDIEAGSQGAETAALSDVEADQKQPEGEETTETAEQEAEPADPLAEPEVPSPRFDLVRAEASGQVLVAGTAAAGHDIRLSVDGTAEASGVADGTGGFVLFLDLPLSNDPRVLDLIAVGPDGTERRAEDSIILAPPQRRAGLDGDHDVAAVPAASAEPQTTAASAIERTEGDGVSGASQAAATVPASDTASVASTAPEGRAGVASPLPVPEQAQNPQTQQAVDPTAQGQVDVAPQEQNTATVTGAPVARLEVADDSVPVQDATPAESVAADALAVPEQTPRAPSVLVARAEGVGLLQPGGAGTTAIDRVVIDVISYDEEGTVTLEGRSAAPPPPVDSVRVYLDNTPIETARIAADGSWSLPLRDVETGVYTLRVDQLDSSGRVVSRFETPFKREDPLNLARLEPQTPATGETLDISVITVQPGYTLWGIASDRYGDGFRYVAIFEANDDQIRDPDLIYPGQVFDLPDLNEN